MICHYFPEPLYFFYVADLPGILYYSHVPAIILALLTGAFVLWSDHRSLLNKLLFGLCLSFSLWSLGTLITWTNIHSDILLFVWSFLGPIAAFISVLSIYFTYVFLQKRDVGLKLKAVFIALLSPILVLAATPYTLGGFNLSVCDAFGFEGPANTIYYPALGAVALIWIFILLVKHYHTAPKNFKSQIVIMGTGIELFLFSFFTIGFLGTYLTTSGFLPDSQIETYGYFGMIVFMVYIGILIVRFKAFHAGLIAAQALVIALIILIGSQFTFARSTTNIVLNGIALFLTAIIGFILIRSVKREIEQREHIEALAKDLEKSNSQQIILIHFITHQIKGFVAKSRNIFATLLEGDYGIMPDTAIPMLKEGLSSDTKGVATIQEILNAANIKSGKVSYEKQEIDLKELVDSIVKELSASAQKKDLTLTVETGDTPLLYSGDRMQLTNAFKNLIDNSIKYTPEGEVHVYLTEKEGKIHFRITDTGVGITAEDMKNLFTEGGHGKESVKVNVESTGFGLYIVKNIIEAHHGKVWATSDGAGKGSSFIVELPR
ncbi:hypothetical protein KKD81_01875 [Patescibacteria group bacterium]|nr:hypothetical protein [Patescibacteria group bacterium]